MYLHLVTGAPAPFEMLRWRLAERFGWTLGEVDGLTIEELHELTAVDDGAMHARRSIIPR